MARVWALLLGVGLVGAACVGILFAEIGLGDLSHTQQGYSCQDPPQNQECADLAARAQFWNGVIALAILTFVLVPAVLIFSSGRRVAPDEDTRPPVV